MTIWKYELPLSSLNNLEIPSGAKILTVQVQNNKPCIWVQVDENNTKETRTFRIYGTGHTMLDEKTTYIGTWQDGIYVFHLFEVIN